MTGKKLDLRIGQTRLESLVVKSMPIGSPESKGELRADSEIEIVERKKDGSVKVRLKEHFAFDPEGPLDIEISLVGRCKADPDITDEEIKSAVKSAGYPLYAVRSQVVGYASGLAVGVPIIIPPYAYLPSESTADTRMVRAELEVSK